jgi:hypothetical protein
MDTTGEKEKRMSKKNVDGRSTSSHDNKKFRSRSLEKQRGMAFGFRKTATAVIKPDRLKNNFEQRSFMSTAMVSWITLQIQLQMHSICKVTNL